MKELVNKIWEMPANELLMTVLVACGSIFMLSFVYVSIVFYVRRRRNS